MKFSSLVAFLFVASFSFSQKEALDPRLFQAAVQSKVLLVDVRTPEEFKTGFISGAVNINWEDSLSFQQEILKLDKAETVYIYCKSGRRSSYAMDWMLANGFTKVIHLSGGIMAWNEAGLPLKNGKKKKAKRGKGKS